MTFSKYPTQLDDNTSLPETVDLVTPVRAEVVNRLRDAIIATQTELGTAPSGVFGTVRARLDSINALISTLSERVTVTEGRLDGLDVTVADLQAQITALEADLAAEVATLVAADAGLQAQIDSLTAAIAVANQIVSPIVSGIQNTDSTTFTAIGAASVNPTTLGHPDATFTLEVILQTTSASYAASFELFNLTEGLVVGHPTITTTSTNATLISVALTIGGSDLPASQANVLEGRIRLASGAATSDRAICKYAAIRAVPS